MQACLTDLETESWLTGKAFSYVDIKREDIRTQIFTTVYIFTHAAE